MYYLCSILWVASYFKIKGFFKARLSLLGIWTEGGDVMYKRDDWGEVAVRHEEPGMALCDHLKGWGWGGRLRGRGYVYYSGWFMLLCSRNHHNTVTITKQKIKIPGGEIWSKYSIECIFHHDCFVLNHYQRYFLFLMAIKIPYTLFKKKEEWGGLIYANVKKL